MVVLTREERRSRVLELHNEGKGTREIAEILHISFRDIADILKDADREKESEQQQARQEFLSSQAYKLFSEGKTPVQVAVDLNIRAQQAIIFQREYWDLKALHELTEIYEEIKCNTWPFVEMYNLSKVAGMNPQHVIKILRIANSDLSSIEYRYETLITEINSLQEQKRDLNNEVTKVSNEAEYYRASCLREKRELDGLRHETRKLEALVRQFKNNNSEYVKIRRSAEEKVNSTLSNGKDLLRLALFSLTESMRKDPEKYSSLIYDDMPSMIDYSNNQYPPYSYGQQQYRSREDYRALLIEDTDKLFNELVKELVDEIISDYPVNTSST